MKHDGRMSPKQLHLAPLAVILFVACNDDKPTVNDGAGGDNSATGTFKDDTTGETSLNGDPPTPNEPETLVVSEPEQEPDDNGQPDVPVQAPCDLELCDEFTHCVPSADELTATCVPNVCEELTCADGTELCLVTPEGAYCRDLTCETDVECEEGEYCAESGLCEAQACEPGARRCDGNSLIACDEHGAAEAQLFECGSSDSYFESECVEGPQTTCTCEDDWDCPPHMICDLGLCSGTGVEPTCSLPPAAFSAEDTLLEISWGGVSDSNREATGSPYPGSAQTQITPLVANLDDDNGDGIIDEQDVPEIIFVTFDNGSSGQGFGGSFTSNGILRAIHGGPLVRTADDGTQEVAKERGADLFAVCDAEADKRWVAGTGFVGAEDCDDDEPLLNSTAPIAVGDLDYDGVPEIVALREGSGNATQVFVYSNLGEYIAKGPAFNVMASSSEAGSQDNAAITIANLDARGNAEIIVGRWVFQLESGEMPAPVEPEPEPTDEEAGGAGNVGPGPGGGTTLVAGANPNFSLYFGPYFEGSSTNGANDQGPVSCVANVIDDGDGPIQEVVAGAAVYSMPLPAADETNQESCTGTDWCDQQLVLRWEAEDARNGFCAVADVLGVDHVLAPGPDNPLDGLPEVVLQGNAELLIYDGQSGTLLRTLTTVANTRNGGPPNVDDFDGDGFPEIGTAAEEGFAVFDLQAPGDACPAWPDFDDRGATPRTAPTEPCDTHEDCGDTTQFACNVVSHVCVCQHNSWVQRTQDASSRVTGSSVFDFNGDGAAEVVYNDECNFRVYDGLSGDVLMEEWGEARTRIEYPVVADVDRDGNAEIVFSTTNESGFCNTYRPAGLEVPDREVFNNGIEVWGDQRDLWVPARSIWNQHAYHVTNVTESGLIPLQEPESWRSFAGRSYNTYRSNPRNYGVAPDLVVRGVQVTSPDAACGSLGTILDIVIDVANEGDLLVGGEVRVGVFGSWGGDFEPLLDADGQPIEIPLGSALAPRQNLLLTISGYSPANNGQDNLPLELRVVVDVTEIETECREDNNERIAEVLDGDDLPDLLIALSGDGLKCPNPVVTVTISNEGSAAASNIEIAFYAGDPRQGGEVVHTITFEGPLEPGTTEQLEVELTLTRAAKLYATIDYTQTIEECNDGNNTSAGPDVACNMVKMLR